MQRSQLYRKSVCLMTALAVGGTMALSGCATSGGQGLQAKYGDASDRCAAFRQPLIATDEDFSAPIVQDAVIGALAGALIGGLTGGGKGALIGAAAGGLTGAGAGYLQAKQRDSQNKSDVLAAIAKSADPLTARAIQTLATGGRAELLPTLAELLRAKLSAHRGELVATVTSARPLSANVQRQLETSLANATGKAVQIQLHQDPEILGGLVVQMGSLRLDASLAGALNTMRAHLHAPAHQS